MHELSLAESVIRIIEEAAVVQKFAQVRVVWLEVGCLAGVEQDALRFSFDAVTRDTVAQGAQLKIVTIPAEGKCTDCGSVHPVMEEFESCPTCGSIAVMVSGGNGLRVKELDVVDTISNSSIPQTAEKQTR